MWWWPDSVREYEWILSVLASIREVYCVHVSTHIGTVVDFQPTLGEIKWFYDVK